MSALIGNQLQPEALACFLEHFVHTEGTQEAKLVCLVAGQGLSWLVQSSRFENHREIVLSHFCQDVPLPLDQTNSDHFPSVEACGFTTYIPCNRISWFDRRKVLTHSIRESHVHWWPSHVSA